MKDRISFELPRMIPPRDAGGAWELATDWRVICGARSLVIPRGFATDGASIPRALWRVCGGSHWHAGLLLAAALGVVCAGCATKTRNVEIDGLFTQAEAGIVALGSVDVQASPVGEETALIKYEEDTAWLSPSTKTHAIRIQLTGSNCVASVGGIVTAICGAFVEVKAAPAPAALSTEKKTP